VSHKELDDLAEKAEELGLDAVGVAPDRRTKHRAVHADLDPLLRLRLLAVARRATPSQVVVGHAHRLAQQLLRRPQVPRAAQHGHRLRRGGGGAARAAAARTVGGRAERQDQRAGAFRPVGLATVLVATAALLELQRRLP
jgi:hypothetical protein